MNTNGEMSHRGLPRREFLALADIGAVSIASHPKNALVANQEEVEFAEEITRRNGR